MNDDDLDLYQWGAKYYGQTPFGINWPADTFYGAQLNLRIALLRLYVTAFHKPIIRPALRMLTPKG
jgi:hypothetical protein